MMKVSNRKLIRFTMFIAYRLHLHSRFCKIQLRIIMRNFDCKNCEYINQILDTYVISC